jgi:uncharacterized protein (TIGR02996 family)
VTTDGTALLDAILAAPFDMAPRLVYADWLQEQGREAAADHIRRRVRLAEEGSSSVRACHVTGFSRLTFHERRGFPFRAAGTLQAFMAHADRLFRTWPITDAVLLHQEPHRNYEGHPGRVTDRAPDHWYVWERHYRDDGGGDPRPHELPRPIFRFLGGRLLERDWVRAFPTRRAALAALRRACVRYGRDLVGLPDIKWPEDGP